jgi:DNA-binding NtrC family response regulator
MLEVEVEEGPNRGARYPVAPGELLVGRDASCGVLVLDDRASRRHARIVRSASATLTIEDLGSRNGTSRNGLPLPPNTPVSLVRGDRIAIGATTLLVREGEGDGSRGESPSSEGRTTIVGRRPLERWAEAPRRDAGRVLAFVARLGPLLSRPDDAGSHVAFARALGGALEVAGGTAASLHRRVGDARVELVATTEASASPVPREALEALVRPDPEALELEQDGRPVLALALPGGGSGAIGILVVTGEADATAWAAIAAVVAPFVVAADEKRALREEAEEARRAVARSVELVGESAPLRQLLDATARAASRDVPVLIRGESGSGKELVARALHEASPRARRRFVAVNAAALPEPLLESELFGHERGAFTGAVARRKGLFELADRGTLFLDEIGELPLGLQPKLLRVLETGEVRPLGSSETLKTQVRVIAATHRDLKRLVQEGRFREDLYFRLAVLDLHVPPLRERREDVPLLARHLLRGIARGKPIELEPAALERLRGYSFPGNVRELRNVLERAWLAGDGATVRVRDLPAELAQDPAASTDESFPTLAQVERRQIELALRRTVGNRSAAARLLGIDRKTLWSKVKALGLGVGTDASENDEANA